MAAGTMKYLVSLDALLDTRLGTVAKLDQKYAFDLLQNNWHLRESDEYSHRAPKFTHEEYVSAYRMRDVDTLRASVMTKLHEYILEMFEDEIKQPGHMSGDLKHGIHINTWPYVLDESTRMMLYDTMRDLFPMFDDVLLVHIPMSTLSPEYIKQNDYRAILLYELKDWLDCHYRSLETTPIPQHYFIVPALLEKAMTPDSLSDDLKPFNEHVGPHIAFEWVHVEYIAFRLIEPVWFSMVFSDV
jgi:hypothetical protein